MRKKTGTPGPITKSLISSILPLSDRPQSYPRRRSTSCKCKVSRSPGSGSYTLSEKFQWLPSDFAVGEDGAVTLISPYINDVYPQKHAALESVVPKLLERAVPLWERVLSDMPRPLLLFRVKSRVENALPDCLFTEADEHHQGSDEDYVTNRDAWLSKKDFKLPDAKEKYIGDLDVMKAPTVSLKGTTLQCIIKPANIVLTPENLEYLGGKWHVEG